MFSLSLILALLLLAQHGIAQILINARADSNLNLAHGSRRRRNLLFTKARMLSPQDFGLFMGGVMGGLPGLALARRAWANALSEMLLDQHCREARNGCIWFRVLTNAAQ